MNYKRVEMTSNLTEPHAFTVTIYGHTKDHEMLSHNKYSIADSNADFELRFIPTPSKPGRP